MGRIFGILHEAPFEEVREHGRLCISCTELIPELFAQLKSGDRKALGELSVRVRHLEEAADDIQDTLRDRLPKNIRLPVSRRDLIQVLGAQDTIADTCVDIVGLLSIRPLPFPDYLREVVDQLIERCLEACREADRLMDGFGPLLEAGFKGPTAEAAWARIDAIGLAERESDDLTLRAITIAFDHEDDLGHLNVVLWFHLVRVIAGLADAAKRLGGRVRLMLAT